SALIADVTAARVEIPMPIVMQFLTHERQFHRRPAPQIVIEARRNRLRTIDFANAAARFVAQSARDLILSQVALLDPFHGLFDSEAGAALRARLDNFFVLARGFDDFMSFPHVVRNWLF